MERVTRCRFHDPNVAEVEDAALGRTCCVISYPKGQAKSRKRLYKRISPGVTSSGGLEVNLTY
jgi:hypothetical protein